MLRRRISHALARQRPHAQPRRHFNNFPPDAQQPVSNVRKILSPLFFKRFVLFSAVGTVFTALCIVTGVEGAHVYVEAVALAPEKDDEVKRWQWDREVEDWGGGLERGGTDSRLGFVGQHLVRASWMTQNWGTSSNQPQDRLLYSHAFLLQAIKNETAKDPTSLALPPLMIRDANVLERLGAPVDLATAYEKYLHALPAFPLDSPERPRITSKLGDLAARIGQPDTAKEWWLAAVRGSARTELPLGREVPDALPAAPYDQRTLCASLLALSSAYASSNDLAKAAQLQQDALRLFAPPTTLPSFDAGKAAASLHTYFLAHRAALFSIHHAEVTYAASSEPAGWFSRKRKTDAGAPSPLALLQSAAETSERIALSLQGMEYTAIPPPSAADGPLLPKLAKASRAIREPGAALLRDARRSAAQAWRLSGLVHTARGDDAHALDCFARALAWAGAGEPAPDTLEVEWNAIWAAFSDAKERVNAKKAAPT
ncbi:hypothetical protein EXIGLDRAFT_737485 [Exidia glandulosa HHB12029]|uniref:TPR-like protein n=1 Tax=Exidia glandulosa HHB12029 TaxID=1314781 RepID=A0A165IXR9_EXIGL|nr:hypothetical protein EXIGLDRAFT_737485 [Exidia glandulosa HHB12029]